MLLLQELDALGSGHEDHELDVLAAPLLHFADGLSSRTAGSQHGIHDQYVTLGNVLGHFAEVRMGLQRFLVPVHTDMANTGGGNHPQHAVHQTQTGPENGDDYELAACQSGGVHLADGGLNVLGGHGQIAGGLIGDEHTDLADQFPEILDAGVLVPHDGQLVGHQGMIHNDYFTHNSVLLYIKKLKTLLNRRRFLFQGVRLRRPEVESLQFLSGDQLALCG